MAKSLLTYAAWAQQSRGEGSGLCVRFHRNDHLVGVIGAEFRAHIFLGQIGIDAGETLGRLWQLSAFAAIILTAMIAVGVYGADALRSMRFATARLLVAISLGVIGLAFVDFLLGGHNFWRSTLAYTMAIAIVGVEGTMDLAPDGPTLGALRRTANDLSRRLGATLEQG